MKVYIGKHTPWWYCRIHDNYMIKKYGYDWNDSTTFFEKFLEKVEDAVNSFYQHTFNRYFGSKKRNIKVKVHDYDVWSLDNTLAHIILPALRTLKENKHGTPSTDREDAPADPIYDDDTNAEEWDRSFSDKRWEYVINEMIHAFECEVNDGWEDQFYVGNIDMRWKKVENDLNEMYTGPDHTHKFLRDEYDKAWGRRKNGLRLFAKYYHNLWT